MRAHPIDWFAYDRGEKELNIVDEREFWSYATGNSPADPPLYATDFLGSKLMRNWVPTVESGMEHNAGQLNIALVEKDPGRFNWYWRPRMDADELAGSDLADLPMTAYLTNLGMTSMNAPLNVRVLDPIGLSTPIAARGPRIEGERIGHDKYLPEYWQLADSASDVHRLPFFASPEKVPAARDALFTPDFVDLYATYRAPLTPQRFIANMKWALKNGRTLEISHDLDDYAGQPVQTGETIVWPIRWGDDSHPQTFLTWPM